MIIIGTYGRLFTAVLTREYYTCQLIYWKCTIIFLWCSWFTTNWISRIRKRRKSLAWSYNAAQSHKNEFFSKQGSTRRYEKIKPKKVFKQFKCVKYVLFISKLKSKETCHSKDWVWEFNLKQNKLCYLY